MKKTITELTLAELNRMWELIRVVAPALAKNRPMESVTKQELGEACAAQTWGHPDVSRSIQKAPVRLWGIILSLQSSCVRNGVMLGDVVTRIRCFDDGSIVATMHEPGANALKDMPL